MSKKGWAILMLSLVTVLAISGCGAANNQADGGFKAGLVTDTGGLNDESFNQTAWEGMEKAKKELGADVKALESKRDEDYIPNLTRFIREKRDITWGIGFKFEKSMRDVAEQFPDAKLGIVDSNMGGKIPSNVVAVTFKEEEGSFLMGVIAGSMTKTNKVGFIGGITSPLIKKFEAGYVAGVHAVNPKAKVEVVYAESFTDEAKGRTIAANMYDQGVDIVYHASGGVGKGLFNEVKTRKKGKYWAIGVDMDQSRLAPDHTLSSMVKRVDVAVFDVMKDLKDGKFAGGKQVELGLKDQAVAVADTTDKYVPADVMKKVEDYRQQIVDGKINVPATDEELKSFLKK
ncbi:BMP family ABC transporter substrate-binding protein [Marinithermofilum abyssi]|uniref:BMP family ABC transporter substrate-binding protein n=1 Tax=Marinithermofilum abyssi TaxID=1571185 RepID=A0A8J2VG24_9BACL|nr:BMP family ABC transporter substrate-binding protein [Marinithermofilum abyssi]GGE24993.1 BMP family ABC transporter substrate-binding protein [Marinithermofilum abyssi]